MKNFSLSPALIATILASGLTQASFAQNFSEGSTNTGGIEIGSTNTGGIAGEGSTNIGHTGDDIPLYSTNPWGTDPWNNQIEDTIRNTKQAATDEFADFKLERAIQIYARQLEKISITASNPVYQLSWTKKIADRTLEITSQLDDMIKDPTDRQVIMDVYATAYDQILNFYTKLDLAYIIPYRQNCKNKDCKVDQNGYEQQLNKYILAQGAWFTRLFYAGTNEFGTLPKYSSKIFLVTLSTLCKGLAADLLTDAVTGPNLFPHLYASSATQLQTIARTIDQHIANGVGRRDRVINNTYKSFSKVMDSIQVK